MSNQNPMNDYLKKLQQVAQQGGKGPFKPPPGATPATALALVVLGGGLLFSNALFNVDGGHRAIKYKRLSGVSKEIYNEGMSLSSGPAPPLASAASLAQQLMAPYRM